MLGLLLPCHLLNLPRHSVLGRSVGVTLTTLYADRGELEGCKDVERWKMVKEERMAAALGVVMVLGLG